MTGTLATEEMYQSGTITQTGNRLYEIDSYGRKIPIAKPSSRHASKQRMLKAIARQNEEQAAFFQRREEVRMERQIRENVVPLVEVA